MLGGIKKFAIAELGRFQLQYPQLLSSLFIQKHIALCLTTFLLVNNLRDMTPLGVQHGYPLRTTGVFYWN